MSLINKQECNELIVRDKLDMNSANSIFKVVWSNVQPTLATGEILIWNDELDGSGNTYIIANDGNFTRKIQLA